MGPNPQISADLVTSTEEILNEKLQFFVQHLSKNKLNLTKKFKFLGDIYLL